MRHTTRALGLLALALVLSRGQARAGIMTPAGLNPGDQFRVIFVSSATRDATSANIADYDTFITDLANAAGLTYNGAPVTWQALGSTATVAATSSGRLPASTSSPPLYRLDGVKVADSTADLWDGTIDAAINVNELGTGVRGLVWTGSDGEPLGADNTPLHLTRVGDPHETMFSFWVNVTGVPNTEQEHLYGYSAVLTVPGAAAVPEPGSLALLGAGALSAGLWGWCRRRAASA
jgi:hypothetical protein